MCWLREFVHRLRGSLAPPYVVLRQSKASGRASTLSSPRARLASTCGLSFQTCFQPAAASCSGVNTSPPARTGDESCTSAAEEAAMRAKDASEAFVIGYGSGLFEFLRVVRGGKGSKLNPCVAGLPSSWSARSAHRHAAGQCSAASSICLAQPASAATGRSRSHATHATCPGLRVPLASWPMPLQLVGLI
jgi:hypothetical protein